MLKCGNGLKQKKRERERSLNESPRKAAAVDWNAELKPNWNTKAEWRTD